ncbi:hypothetical protein P618_200188 [Holospora obtusa F1]|uniref:Uncharacterized protein n=1 Tax=Holospora obtusa F1 TaxID=1399147 RepID=W6TF74_HOLOB|nr:hypothetical protein [Holospora obtusa]ETZ07626.1 hypothetical protein P618_200188 [Holospora obtusa F1]
MLEKFSEACGAACCCAGKIFEAAKNFGAEKNPTVFCAGKIFPATTEIEKIKFKTQTKKITFIF